MKKKLLILAIVLILLLYISTFFIFSNYIPLSPDENSYIYFSKMLVNNNSLSYSETLNEKYNSSLFAPRNTVYSKITNVVSPIGFFGIFLFLAYTRSIIENSLLLFAFISLIGILFFYLLTRELFGNKISIFSSITLVILPQYWFWSFRIMPDISSLVFLFGGMAFNLIGNKKENIFLYIIAGLLFSISIWFRYINIIYVGLFILLFNFKDVKRIFILGTVITLFVLPILLLNNSLYGSYLTTGYNLYSENSPLIVIPVEDNSSIITFVFSNIFRFFILYNKIFTLLGLLGVILVFIKKDDPLIKRFTIYFITISILTLGYFSWGNFYGSLEDTVKLNFSSIRYYLIIYSILVVYSYYFLFNTLNRKILPYILMIIVSTSFLLSLSSAYDLLDSKDEMLSNSQVKTYINDITPENSIIFTRFWDKTIFPERKVVNYYGNGLAEKEVEITNTIKLMELLLNDKYDVYFLKEDFDPILVKERRYIYFNEYQTRFKEHDISLIKLNDIVYKAEKINKNDEQP